MHDPVIAGLLVACFYVAGVATGIIICLAVALNQVPV
jgi:hypothetical protein